MHHIIIVELRATEPLVPVVLVVGAPDAEIRLELLVIPLRLAIHLRMIGSRWVALYALKLHERLQGLLRHLLGLLNHFGSDEFLTEELRIDHPPDIGELVLIEFAAIALCHLLEHLHLSVEGGVCDDGD